MKNQGIFMSEKGLAKTKEETLEEMAQKLAEFFIQQIDFKTKQQDKRSELNKNKKSKHE